MDTIQLNIFGGEPKVVIHAKQGEKTCTVCGEVKSLNDFYVNNQRKTGRTWRCKECQYLYELMKKYGITKSDYDKMLSDQDGKCYICGSNDSKTMNSDKLFVDHCHTTSNVRGLLCSKCNSGLGNFEDDIESLEKAIEYLKKHKFAKP